MKLGKTRREISKRNYFIISPRVIQAIIIVSSVPSIILRSGYHEESLPLLRGLDIDVTKMMKYECTKIPSELHF